MSESYINYVGIDLSLTSTGVSLFNLKTQTYTYLSFMKNYTKPTKWTKILDDYIEVTGVTYRHSENYSEQEVYKIEDYDKNMNFIIEEITKHLVVGKTIVAIEGYSYGSSNTVSLLDLIALGTLLRNKIKTKLNADIHIYSPSELKQMTCGLVYGWKAKNKKATIFETRNSDGMAGGSFTKREMFKALNDYPCDSNMSKFCKQNYSDIYKMATIPAPIPDLIDSYWLLKILMNDKLFHIRKVINNDESK